MSPQLRALALAVAAHPRAATEAIDRALYASHPELAAHKAARQ